MDAADVTSLTTAYDTSALVTTFVAFAPWIIGVAGLLVAIGLISWGIKKSRKRLSGGVA